ncbi:MAG: ABC transporter substrate-binding protein [Desulfobacterales bacterium]|nr:MAG: ABC transporter substrate-binding protein [Desulfobacterales bacterium]
MKIRVFIFGVAIVTGLALLGPGVTAVTAAEPLRVGAYGGYFKDSFDKHIFPDFTKETGIAIESVAEPTGEAWLVQLEQAAKAGQAPADVSMMAQGPMLRGQRGQLWIPLDLAKIPNHKNLLAQFVHKYPDGKADGIGAVAWYITLVSNTNVFKEPPQSWGDMWQPDKKDKLGLLALASNSFLLEITAKTFFGGTDFLDTQKSILTVLQKLAEVKPNVKLWYRDEGQFQQALQSGEIPMGQYYHDVAGLAAADGHPVRSTFPKEGGVLDSGCWAVSKASKKVDEAHIFINYMCRPDIQAKLSRKVGTAPTVKRELTGLTPEEFAGVSSDIPPIIPRYDLYTGDLADWINQKWTEMITK